jgi:hypothetical protein
MDLEVTTMDSIPLGDVKVCPFVNWSYELRIRLMIARWKYYLDPYSIKSLFFLHNEQVSFYFLWNTNSSRNPPNDKQMGPILKFLQTMSLTYEI